ncbi:LOW QUALITY PROTEIN: UBN2 domain-containing protein, partial [Cephalotus follicularis]
LLEVTYEGTNQVKEKISMLVHEYELFLMHDNESISDMFTRFTTIINSLKNLGKSYSNQELVRKILRCLPKSHFKSECPNLKKNAQFKKKNEYSKRKKMMVATWDDSDPSSSEEESDEEVANIAFMAIEEEEEDEVNFSFDELQDAYENLFHEYKNVCLKNKSLKK